ncbi:hypothetical protein RIR_jg21609.t1 [Rhizophagus irregularis DAOM 181602=DAOM 197198]|nr:hypothetical protein RIR_jg21609.t1 [Rhizophagus irregularis DAOM 181602=DAOM 197198]
MGIPSLLIILVIYVPMEHNKNVNFDVTTAVCYACRSYCGLVVLVEIVSRNFFRYLPLRFNLILHDKEH